MNPKMMNLDYMNLINNKGNKISVFFNNSKFNCFEDDITYKLLEKFEPYLWKFQKYLSNGKKINPFITVKENGINDCSIIVLNSMINLVFYGNYGSINIALDEDYPFKKAFKYFLLRIGKDDCYDKFTFLFKGKKLNIEDKTPIKNIFSNSGSNSIQYINIGL